MNDYETVRATAAAPGTANEVLAALMLLRELRDELSGWEPQLIEAARALGTSWADLAPALGVASRQAAERRYLRVRRTGEGGTGDERVQAERDRRAGDKAVTAWARENAGVLRVLAAQVGPTTPACRTHWATPTPPRCSNRSPGRAGLARGPSGARRADHGDRPADRPAAPRRPEPAHRPMTRRPAGT
ncbi:hypothetical protein [Lentzea guizhouensis]|uniref:hypothetical protein n=1 Tax=Lentzea guizhouensis TaxID=1586287 RepID=UPI000A99C76D